MRRKQASKRRWKARCRINGKLIPMTAIVEHRLNRWFDFPYAWPPDDSFYYAYPKRRA